MSALEKPPPRWEKAFLAGLREHGLVCRAAQDAGISKSWVYDRREASTRFARLWDEALDISTEILEAEAMRRALSHESPSDTLLIFLLKARRPNVYRDNVKVEHFGQVGVVPIREVRVIRNADSSGEPVEP